MDPKDLKRILEALVDADVNDFNLETADYKLHVKRGAEVIHMAAPAHVAAPNPVVVAAPPVSSQPAAAAVVAPSAVEAAPSAPTGHVLCIIEAMKLMNEIESDKAGVVKQILVQNAQPVEYGQPLFIIE
jgi:acetyl-CoA carboxylase biotin carboxyl carrier protein